MSRFSVSIPIAGAMHIAVTADSGADAIAAAWARFEEEGPKAAHEIEWEAFEKIAEGNVLHAPHNEVEVSDVGAVHGDSPAVVGEEVAEGLSRLLCEP